MARRTNGLSDPQSRSAGLLVELFHKAFFGSHMGIDAALTFPDVLALLFRRVVAVLMVVLVPGLSQADLFAQQGLPQPQTNSYYGQYPQVPQQGYGQPYSYAQQP